MNQGSPPIASAVQVDYRVYDREDAARLFAGREIYIWGAGQKGRGFRLALERNGFTVKAYLDRSPQLIGTSHRSVPILDPREVLLDPSLKGRAFILSASVDKRNAEIFRECEQAGLEKGRDYINIQELAPYYPTVEICGTCNLRCVSCPRGNSTTPPPRGGFMKAADYQRVVDKLVREMPFVYLVDLYIWGEPLLNPELPEMIRINNRLGIATGISSNLNAARHLEEVVEAAPAQIRVSLSGYGKEHYEATHRGGRWDLLHDNLHRLARHIEAYRTETLVEVYFHVNRHNIEEMKEVHALSRKLGFRFYPCISIAFVDYAMDFLDGVPLCPEAQVARDLMLVSLEEMIDHARAEQHRACLLKRVLPVVNWDLSVLPCCNYSLNKIGKDTLAANYLGVPLEDIIQRRCASPLCIKCQSLALHRYFHPLRYADQVNALMGPDYQW